MHFFLKLSKTYQSNIIYPWAMSLPYLSVSVSHSCLHRCPLTLCDPPRSPHVVSGCACPAQPVDNPTTSSSPRDRLTSFLLCLHSLPFSSYLHWAPLPSSVREAPSARPNPKPASTPPTPLRLNLPDSFSTLTSPQQEATPAALRHFLSEMLTLHPNRILLHAFFLFSCRDLCLLCVLEKSCRLAICFLALFPAPTVEAVFSVTGCVWTLNLVSHTQPWPLFSPWPSPPCEQVPGINHTFSSPLLESYHFIHNVLWGGCHLYSRINKAVCQLDLLFKIKNMNLLQWV